MKTAILLSLFALPLSAGNIWFDPPNPTSQTHVIAHVRAGTACPITGSDAAVHGSIVSITLHAPAACATPLPPNGFSTTVDLGVLPAGVYDVVAGPETLLIALAEGTLVVQDAEPPFRLSPNVSQSGVVDNVTIKGAGIAPACPVTLCTPPVVMFGDKKAEVVQQIDTDTLLVTPPNHEPGIVDVTTFNGSKTFRATAAFDYFGSSFDPAFFEPVLFPVIINGPGAFGSEWRTDATLRNDNDYTLPVYSIFDMPVQAVPPPMRRPAAHSSVFATPFQSLPNGDLVELPRESAARVSFGLLVKDLSHQAEAFGTQIPVVRENDFFDRPFTLLDVPADSRYRVALRLYRLDDGTSAHIRISQLNAQEALVDTFVSLTPAGGAYSIAYDGDLLKTYPILAGKGPLRIDIDAGDGQHEIWGFVSITNNDTQHVSVVSPQ